MEIKNKLKKHFDKEIYSISKNGDLYYVVLCGDEFIKPVYVTDIDGKHIEEIGIPLPELKKMELVYNSYHKEC